MLAWKVTVLDVAVNPDGIERESFPCVKEPPESTVIDVAVVVDTFASPVQEVRNVCGDDVAISPASERVTA